MGKVIFVGAGPGDPGLLTLTGRRALEQADVILFDRLVHPLLLRLTKPESRLVFVGKYPKNHIKTQEEINQALVVEGCKSQLVVRLKGGDPSIFGRISEEVEALREQQIDYQIVPGITAASAAAAYSGFPLTDRSSSTGVCFRTAHYEAGKTTEYPRIMSDETMCFYMGVGQAKVIEQQLLSQGLATNTPLAVVQWASLGRQLTLLTQLDQLSQMIDQHRITPPALVMIGLAVTNRKGTDWFEKLADFGHQKLLISSGHIDFDQCLAYSEKGADIYPLSVGPARDQRFDAIDEIFLKRHMFDGWVYLDDDAQGVLKKERRLDELLSTQGNGTSND